MKILAILVLIAIPLFFIFQDQATPSEKAINMVRFANAKEVYPNANVAANTTVQDYLWTSFMGNDRSNMPAVFKMEQAIKKDVFEGSSRDHDMAGLYKFTGPKTLEYQWKATAIDNNSSKYKVKFSFSLNWTFIMGARGDENKVRLRYELFEVDISSGSIKRIGGQRKDEN